jgi:hypothetical protein
MSSIRDLRGQSFFYGFDDRVKASWIANRNLRQRLAIEFNVRFVQAVDELTVPHPPHSAGRIDSSDPQSAKLSFLDAAIAERKYACSNESLFHGAKHVSPTTAIAFGSFEEPAFGFGASRTFGSTHLI